MKPRSSWRRNDVSLYLQTTCCSSYPWYLPCRHVPCSSTFFPSCSIWWISIRLVSTQDVSRSLIGPLSTYSFNNSGCSVAGKPSLLFMFGCFRSLLLEPCKIDTTSPLCLRGNWASEGLFDLYSQKLEPHLYDFEVMVILWCYSWILLTLLPLSHCKIT